MRRPVRQSISLAILLMAVLSSIVTSPVIASAAESVPPLQWPSVSFVDSAQKVVTSPTGSVTIPCTANSGGRNLMTYSSTGQLVQNISRTQLIDGVGNCIISPAVDNNGTVYGIPYGQKSNGTYAWGPNLLAYTGNTLKWKYPATSCGDAPAVGPNGIIYLKTWFSDGQHLIGLAPDLQAGQTQPTKVLDVKVTNKCSARLRPFRDGIMLAPLKDYNGNESPGNPEFYSYSGKYLGQSPVGDDTRDEDANTDGQLFLPQYTWGSYKSGSVGMYDFRKGAVAWVTPGSTPGADVRQFHVYPVQAGGAVAVINEQKMLTGGVPASPPEWVWTLTTFNAGGQKVRSITLSNMDSQGNPYLNFWHAVDSNGKVAVLREGRTATSVSDPTTVPRVDISIYDAMTSAWVYQNVLAGDVNKPGGPNGYGISDQPVLANNTLVFAASCSYNCTAPAKKLYAANVAGLGMDYPRGAVLAMNTPAQPVPVPYVALGDSYSSGEGVEPFENASNNPGVDECHRSELAYAKQVSRNPQLAATLVTGKFVACSGAKTEHVKDTTFNTEPAQSTSLNGTTKVVTITIGGNDIGFVDFGTACVVSWDACNFGSPAYASAVNKINNELPDKLKTTYRKLLTEAPAAKILVLGYPQVAPIKTATDAMDPRCSYLYNSGYDSTGTIPKYWEDAQAARDVVDKLNSKIQANVNVIRAEAAGNVRLQYVEVNASNSPFAGHTVCADPGESYFNNIDQWVGHPAYALHPNARGQQAYADLVTAALVQ